VIDGANRTDSSRLDPVTAGQAETANGLDKAELVDWEGPWKGADDLEFAMLRWASWFAHTRLRFALPSEPQQRSRPSTTVTTIPPSDRSRDNWDRLVSPGRFTVSRSR